MVALKSSIGIIKSNEKICFINNTNNLLEFQKKYYTFKKITVILYKKREKFEIIVCFYPFAMKRRDEFRK